MAAAVVDLARVDPIVFLASKFDVLACARVEYKWSSYPLHKLRGSNTRLRYHRWMKTNTNVNPGQGRRSDNKCALRETNFL